MQAEGRAKNGQCTLLPGKLSIKKPPKSVLGCLHPVIQVKEEKNKINLLPFRQFWKRSQFIQKSLTSQLSARVQSQLLSSVVEERGRDSATAGQSRNTFSFCSYIWHRFYFCKALVHKDRTVSQKKKKKGGGGGVCRLCLRLPITVVINKS